MQQLEARQSVATTAVPSMRRQIVGEYEIQVLRRICIDDAANRINGVAEDLRGMHGAKDIVYAKPEYFSSGLPKA